MAKLDLFSVLRKGLASRQRAGVGFWIDSEQFVVSSSSCDVYGVPHSIPVCVTSAPRLYSSDAGG